MKILFIGDIFGKCGRKAVSEMVPYLKQNEGIDLVIANAENTSNGKGLSVQHYNFLKKCDIDYITMGNHTWDKQDIYEIFLNHHDIIRPGNIDLLVPNDLAQSTLLIVKNNLKIRLTNLMGFTCMNSKRFVSTSPFSYLKNLIKKCNDDYEVADFHIVDFHAESTAEKCALFKMFDGKVNAIFGTHTHVQTNDNQISKLNTAFITEVGFTGANNSIIGADPKGILPFYDNQTDKMHIDSGSGLYQFCAVVLEINEKTKQVESLKKIFHIEGSTFHYS